MRTKLTVLVVAACLIAGCDKGSAEGVVRSQLKDPDSAKFEAFTKSKDGTRACLAVNAKNEFGGYTGERQWMLEKSGSGWTSLGAISSDAATHAGCVEAINLPH